jgi:hypothetical protein
MAVYRAAMTPQQARALTVVGGVLVAVGAVLPWATVLGFVSVSGLSGDGLLALGLGTLIAVMAFLRTAPVLLSLAALAAVGLYAFELAQVTQFLETREVTLAAVGGGLWVGMLGAVLAFVASARVSESVASP